MILSTPLGEDALIIGSIEANEGISRLYRYHIEAWGDPTKPVVLHKLLRQPVCVELRLTDDKSRYFHGIVTKITKIQPDGDSGMYLSGYNLVVEPSIAVLMRREQCRIFQQKSVPDILKEVLANFEVKYQLTGAYDPREYCVQYRESDFNFISRICEDEGIFYFFEQSEEGCKLVLADSSQPHPELPHGCDMTFVSSVGGGESDREIWDWQKAQSLGTGKVTLWDSHFQLPFKQLEGTADVVETVQVGKQSYALRSASTDLEIYDYPGGYAERYDEVSKDGGANSCGLDNVFDDGKRTARVRGEEQAVEMIRFEGHTNWPNMQAGHRFELLEHSTDSDKYVVLSSDTIIRQPLDPHSDTTVGYDDFVRFECIPLVLPYRPPRVTRVPVISGPQTAYVVGPPGEEIYTDKYGRVKVAFHWDRNSSADAASSCWIRVAQSSAGNYWGSFNLPRIGHEVIVFFIEGDPERPIIAGSVYNAASMPPYGLPDNKTRTSYKSRSSPGGGGYNEIRYEDSKKNEQFYMHAQKDMDVCIQEEKRELVKKSSHLTIVESYNELIKKDHSVEVKGDDSTKIGGKSSLEASGGIHQKSGGLHAVDASQEIHLKAGMKVIIEAGTQISLTAGGSFVDIGPSGVSIKGAMVMLNSGGSAGSGSGASPKAPEAPKEAKCGDAGKDDKPPPPRKYTPPAKWSPMAYSMQKAASSGAALCDL